MAKVLEVKNLSKAFGGVQAVDHVSFDLEAGQLLAMIGPNGAGKSTCFNLVNGQLRADSGSVSVLGRRTAGMRPREVWQLGVGRTFQITSTFATMTVLENVQLALLSHHGRTRSLLKAVRNMYADESMELLEMVGLGEQAGRSCGVLAYGDLKRVELAVALANRPKLLLMDEPTAGMGTSERSRLMALTTGIVRRREIGVLFTEHDMDVVFGNADRVIVLNRGRLVAQGTPEEVRANRELQEIYLGSTVEATP
jgi:branched-chain amino acid transport system ATP-binding protein